MKFIFVFILGFALGAYVFTYYPPYDRHASTAAHDTRDAIDDKIQQWHLRPDDIRADLSKTGEVVRTQAKTVGSKIDDARIVTVIKSKYVLDRDLSAVDIHVDARGGDVALVGTVASETLIGRAVALALDTDGVTHVAARLKVSP